MRVVVDTSLLSLLFDRSTAIPPPSDGSATPPDVADRIDYLVETLDRERVNIIVPTPVLAEILSRATGAAAGAIIERLGRSPFEIVPFDAPSAVECGLMLGARWRERRSRGKRDAAQPDKHKIKFDSQIVAIAKTRGATVIYSDDKHIKKLGVALGMTVYGIHDLPTRPQPAQYPLPPAPAGTPAAPDHPPLRKSSGEPERSA